MAYWATMEVICWPIYQVVCTYCAFLLNQVVA